LMQWLHFHPVLETTDLLEVLSIKNVTPAQGRTIAKENYYQFGKMAMVWAGVPSVPKLQVALWRRGVFKNLEGHVLSVNKFLPARTTKEAYDCTSSAISAY